MSGRNVSVDRYQPKASTSPKSVHVTQNSSNEDIIYRIVIDPTADIGSLYDARIDSALENLSPQNLPISTQQLSQSVICSIGKIDTAKDVNLFHMIGIDKEQWLSLMLETKPSDEIDSLIDYSLLTDKNSRFLYYYHTARRKVVRDDQNKVKPCFPSLLPQSDATHIITGVEYGINVVVHLQLSSDNHDSIDPLLERIKTLFDEDQSNIKQNFSPDEKKLLNESITITVIFSNIRRFIDQTDLLDLCHEINKAKNNPPDCRQLKYILRPIQWLYSSNTNKNIPLKTENMKKIEEYLFELLHVRRSLKRPLDRAMENSLEKEYYEVQQEIEKAEEICSTEISRIRGLVLNMRNGASQTLTMGEMHIDEHRETLENTTKFIENRLKPLIEKGKLIGKLNEHRVKYLNVTDHCKQKYVDLKIIEQNLLNDGGRKIIFCCKDGSKEQNQATWDDIYTKWIKEYEIDSSVELIYADFSYYSYPITEMMILLSDDMKKQLKNTSTTQVTTNKDTQLLSTPTDAQRSISKVTPSSVLAAVVSSTSPNTTPPSENGSSSASHHTCASHPKNKTSSTSTAKLGPVSSEKPPITSEDPRSSTSVDTASSTPEETSPSKKFRSDQSDLPTVKFVNVLLLGESGVGKSTFINALVNYLTFETLAQAHSEQPLVVMPVSFMMTVGDHFDEKIIRFGGIDPNEDHHHPGQSVTQHCRSYVFQIGTQTKLRVIDTPGMGDTRGLDQDDLNMQHILSFVNNLPHLNAICILLKPNESRLNVVLRSYFTRLLNFLGENARKNIVFCFTNTRATFFAPGNTGPLLRKMINDLPIKGIPFQKTNTFCFDSEAFRYLIALQNGIEFDKYQEDEYERSWKSSVIESNRLLKYICGGLVSYSQNEWQSIEHAQSKISQVIRPVLEAIRNIFRNIILLKEKSSKKLIKLIPRTLSQPSAICYTCERAAIPLCDFWILPDDLHNLEDICQTCICGRQKHVSVDYRLEYDSFDVLDGQSLLGEMQSDLRQLKKALLECAQFYAYIFYTTKQNDPLLSGLKRMIREENQVCSLENTKRFNLVLHDELEDIKKGYVEYYDTAISCRKPINLLNIYKAIEKISSIDMVSGQMKSIKKAQKKYMEQHEKKIS